jgi:Ser/Thr protein kinase RdoA (MazF antagonist)
MSNTVPDSASRASKDTVLDGVLKQYGLENAEITVLRDLGNTVLRADWDSSSYSVRFCLPSVTRERLETELDWLEVLRRDTGLIVPNPVLNASGERITAFEDRLAVAFRWVGGELVSEHMSPQAAREIGRLTAKLHHHARTYRPKNAAPTSFDLAWLNGPRSWWMTQAKDDLPDDYASLEPCIAFCASVMEKIGTSSQHFGLIHSDLNFGNILVHDGQYRVIDFEACGMGYYLMDLGVTEIEFLDYENGLELVESFRSAYSVVGRTKLEPSELAAFRIAGCVVYLEWLFTNPNERVRTEKMRWVPRTLTLMREAHERYA